MTAASRQEMIQACLAFPAAYEDYPFSDANWTVMRHRGNQKAFALLFERDGCLWMNLKCDPMRGEFLREAFAAIRPAYHMNKTHWISLVLDGSLPEELVHDLLADSYTAIRPKRKMQMVQKQKKRWLELLLLADPDEDMLDKYLDTGELYLCTEGTLPVGVAVVAAEDVCELKNLAVAEPFWHCGIGSEMLAWLCRQYRTAYDIMRVGTSAAGRAFYEKNGFTYTHTVKDFFVTYYPEPIFENGRQVRDMVYLAKKL